MEEMEVPTEGLQEEIHHHAHMAESRWVAWVALSSALLAVLAAVAALMAGHHANEAMLEQIKASDKWSYYQAKGIKAEVLGVKMELLKASGKEASEKDAQKAEQYKGDQEEISKEAKELEHSAAEHMERHVPLARSVTMFQVAIGVAAISVLTQRRRYWVVGLIFGATGVMFLAQGLLGIGMK